MVAVEADDADHHSLATACSRETPKISDRSFVLAWLPRRVTCVYTIRVVVIEYMYSRWPLILRGPNETLVLGYMRGYAEDEKGFLLQLNSHSEQVNEHSRPDN